MGEKLHILERIENDEVLRLAWEQLDDNARQMFQEIDEGTRVPNMLSDTIFKGIFNPDVYGDRLSRFISSILGRKVKVLHSLSNESYPHSEHSKKIIFDLLVQFEDGSIANVEIQRLGIRFPSARAALYSADVISRQFATLRGEKKSELDYHMAKPMYTIIILEKSSGPFLKSDSYIHHFKQRSDTGIELEFLQYYDYICLDVFKEKNPRAAGELEKWLKFLSIESTEEMKTFLQANPSFQSVYDCAIIMLKDREELLRMISDFWAKEDVIGSINLTNESIIKELQEKLEKSEKEKETLAKEKDAEIEHLRKLLAEKN